MPIRKSIRDIQTSNTISDMVSVEPIKKNRVRKIDQSEEIVPEEESYVYTNQNKTETPPHQVFKYKKIITILSQIKTIYLLAFGIIILGLAVLIFIPANSTQDPIEKSKKEAEVVKKQFSKHIILPENEQIDIRKITNKMEDLFFKDAEIGDYLIIFYKNRIAYIYSVDKDIIVNAGVVFIDPKTATTTSSTTKTQ